MTRLHIDCETFSEVPIASGVDAYLDHTAELLLVGWAFDDDPVQVWDTAQDEPMPFALDDGLNDPDTFIWAFNAAFERRCLNHFFPDFDLPISRFRCTMVQAYSLGFYGKLSQVLSQFHVKNSKLESGQKLINKFCKPQTSWAKEGRLDWDTDPEDWVTFKEYCKVDVEVERELMHKTVPFDNVVWRHYQLDQEVNDRGMPVDMKLVMAALNASEEERDYLMAELEAITGLDNPNSRTQFMSWMAYRKYPLPNLQKETVIEHADIIEAEGGPFEVRRAMALKSQLAKTSVAKWRAIRDAQVDGRVRGCFQFVGASRTGRWAGRKVQPHNLPRPVLGDEDMIADIFVDQGYPFLRAIGVNVMEALGSLTRSAITASPGNTLVVSDWSSIESRIAGWICECPAINTIFAEGRDVYRDFAARIFNKPEFEVTKAERTFAKPGALGCQYMLGARGLMMYAKSLRVSIPLKQAGKHVRTYREAYPEIVNFWHNTEAMYFHTVDSGYETCFGPGGLCNLSRQGQFLRVGLPSGRAMYYYRPRVEEREIHYIDEDDQPQVMVKDCLTFEGRHDKYGWVRIGAHPGHILENLVQAIARDVLMTGLIRAKNASLNIVGHVHDEIITESRRDLADSGLATLNSCMTRPMDWAPGLLLGSAGYIARRYRKE